VIKIVGTFFLCFFLVGCSTQPSLNDFALARTALQAAREAGAARYAPGYWHKAEESYRTAERLFSQEKYKEANAKFVHSRKMSEKAENISKLQMHKSGGGIP
jgi:hypothetical protein